ncbi:hypothetical protein [Sphingomicrobium clamense]|uniref:Lipoprotein n=1 Tax=Sphingomicrobium clamense TaxID=2851013 RepID=A0ABS6V2N5_9SPHN|nr:hypothetical protein [Sphingomicrobium sp. B8]MBW0143820.1 hypothetical protein [Sphingomicrobium sp. B8]
MRFSTKAILICAVATTSACSTANYTMPKMSASISNQDPVAVYLDQHLTTYEDAMSKVADTQDDLAIVTTLAALGGTTAMALGAGTDVGIIAGAAGSGAGAAKNYMMASERMALLIQASRATLCLREEYVGIKAVEKALIDRFVVADIAEKKALDASYDASLSRAKTLQSFLGDQNMNYVSHMLDEREQITVDAARAVALSLQLKLNNLQSVPDYSATVRSIREAQQLADAATTNRGDDPEVKLLTDDIASYKVRVEACKAMLPA